MAKLRANVPKPTTGLLGPILKRILERTAEIPGEVARGTIADLLFFDRALGPQPGRAVITDGMREGEDYFILPSGAVLVGPQNYVVDDPELAERGVSLLDALSAAGLAVGGPVPEGPGVTASGLIGQRAGSGNVGIARTALRKKLDDIFDAAKETGVSKFDTLPSSVKDAYTEEPYLFDVFEDAFRKLVGDPPQGKAYGVLDRPTAELARETLHSIVEDIPQKEWNRIKNFIVSERSNAYGTYFGRRHASVLASLLGVDQFKLLDELPTINLSPVASANRQTVGLSLKDAIRRSYMGTTSHELAHARISAPDPHYLEDLAADIKQLDKPARVDRLLGKLPYEKVAEEIVAGPFGAAMKGRLPGVPISEEIWDTFYRKSLRDALKEILTTPYYGGKMTGDQITRFGKTYSRALQDPALGGGPKP